MPSKLQEQQIRNLYQMLFEMATGNLAYRLSWDTDDGALGSLGNELNTFAARMQGQFLEHGYVTPFYSCRGSVDLAFILDKEWTIRKYSSNTNLILGLGQGLPVLGDMERIIAPGSREAWRSIVQKAAQKENFHTAVELTFRTQDNLLLPGYCTISRLHPDGDILVCSVSTVLQGMRYGISQHKDRKGVKTSDAETIQQLHDYIMGHLEEPLPGIRVLSGMFRTNEFELKKGFRTLFHTSIYQFYNEQRLRRAHLIILHSEVPLKEVAFMCGFNSYLNFYKAFKRKFLYAPSDLCRLGGVQEK